MKIIEQSFSVPFTYQVYFTEGLFGTDNPLFKNILEKDTGRKPLKTLFVIDSGLAKKHPHLQKNILQYLNQYPEIFAENTHFEMVQGGESVKNSTDAYERLLKLVEEKGICRHSYLIAIGGGAVLDMAGFAAAVAHRGVRHIRIPTTVLAQNDSGVGVKNSINAFGKKNFLGTFKPPQAVINDFDFLTTLEDRDWRAGISEAIKVALIKDKDFYWEIKNNTEKLNSRDKKAMQDLIFRCAEMHLEHIAGKDPFESGSSRPLDFGHWAAHKLEQLTSYQIRHGEAVAIGMALDVTYSYLKGMLSKAEFEEIMDLIQNLGFELYVAELAQRNPKTEKLAIWQGLNEFREHLGGQLTIMLLDKIGHGLEVHEMEEALIEKAVVLLKEKQKIKEPA